MFDVKGCTIFFFFFNYQAGSKKSIEINVLGAGLLIVRSGADMENNMNSTTSNVEYFLVMEKIGKLIS